MIKFTKKSHICRHSHKFQNSILLLRLLWNYSTLLIITIKIHLQLYYFPTHDAHPIWYFITPKMQSNMLQFMRNPQILCGKNDVFQQNDVYVMMHLAVVWTMKFKKWCKTSWCLKKIYYNNINKQSFKIYCIRYTDS